MKNLILVSILLLAMACDNPNSEMYGGIEAFEDIIDVPNTEQPAPPQEGIAEQITKKVVKTGGIDFQSEDIEKDYKKIREVLPKFNAYVESENQTKSAHRVNYSLTVRVPSNVYDTLYGSLSDLAFRLDNKYSNITDVTERYYDLKTRIKNKKTLEKRYIQLLDKASAVKDILEIEKNLNQVRTEIERFEGQFNYLSKQVNFSTIHLSFYEVLPYVYDSSQRPGFGARILSALADGWQGFLSLLIGLVTLWPFVLFAIGGIYLFKRVKRNWKK